MTKTQVEVITSVTGASCKSGVMTLQRGQSVYWLSDDLAELAQRWSRRPAVKRRRIT